MREIAKRLAQARKAAGYKTATEFAEKNDIPQPTYAMHESGKRGLSRGNTLDLYAEKLGIRKAWLQFGEGPMRADTQNPQLIKGSSPLPQKSVAETSETRLEFAPGARRDLPRDLPILGYVKAGERGFFIDQGQRQGVAVRPETLLDNPDAYGVWVHDTSMMPALEPGWLLHVDPHRPVKPGHLVVIQLTDGQSFIKKLIRRTEKAVICEQYNPPDPNVKYDPKNVRSVHRVVGSSFIET